MNKLLAAPGVFAAAIAIGAASPPDPPPLAGSPAGAASGVTDARGFFGGSAPPPSPCGAGQTPKTVCEVRSRPPAPPTKICKQVCVAVQPQGSGLLGPQ